MNHELLIKLKNKDRLAQRQVYERFAGRLYAVCKRYLKKDEEAEEALAFHNKARNDVGVAPLTWSSELSSYAQEWADHLAKNSGCKLEHRSSSGNNGKNYGENIAMRPPQNHSAKDASKAWYDEISQFTNVILNENNWYDTGHYSQMVWHNTTQLGIGSAKCANGNYIIVANYDPSGNYMGQKAY